MAENDDHLPDSLLPYDEWMQEALRQVAVSALRHAVQNGLPGGHHFYITFKTGFPGVDLPERLRAQYPEEMTIVLQHQFHSLGVNDAGTSMSVGLSFGGVPVDPDHPVRRDHQLRRSGSPVSACNSRWTCPSRPRPKRFPPPRVTTCPPARMTGPPMW